MADQLATPEDLASLIQQTDLDRATCELLIEAATAVVQAICGQRIVEVVDDPFEVVGSFASYLTFPGGPTTAVSSVTINGISLSAGTASGTYRLVGGALYRDIGWADSGGPTLVAGLRTHGYPPGSQHLQLGRAAVLSLSKGAFVNPDGVFSEKIDDYSVAYERSAAALEASPFLASALRKQYGQKAAMVNVM